MKKRHILIKEFFREVKNSYARFLSILLIVLLGVAFFSGVRAGGPDMRLSADIHFDQADLMDIRVLSTLGLTKDDVIRLEQIEGISRVRPSYSVDVLCRMEDSQPVIHLMTFTDQMNTVTVKQGKYPEKNNEIFLDQSLMEHYGLKIGDSLSLSSGKADEKISDILKETEYTIVGSGTSPFYLSLDRGTSTIGNGTVAGFGVIPMGSFSMDVYTEVYLSVEGAKEEICYEDAYPEIVDKVKKQIEEIADEQCEIRYVTVLADGKESIEEAKNEIEHAQEELKKANKKLENGKKKLEDGKKKLIENEEKLNKGEEEVHTQSQTLKKGKHQLSTAQQQILIRQEQLQQGLHSLVSAKDLLAQQEEELLAGMLQIEEGWKQWQEGELQISNGKKKLEDAKAQLVVGLQALEEKKPQIELAKEQLLVLKEQKQTLQSILEPYDQVCEAITEVRAQNQALQEEIAELEAELENAEQSQQGAIALQLEEKKQCLQESQKKQQELEETERYMATEMSDALSKREQLIQTITSLEEQISGYEQQVSTLETSKQQLQKEEEALQDHALTLQQQQGILQEKSQQLEAGKLQLEAGKKQLATSEQTLQQGAKQLQDASTVLQDKKSQLLHGEKQLATAAKTIEEGRRELAEAKVTLLEKEKELTKAEKEFLEKSQDAQKEIAEGEKQISEAEEELKKLELPTWYVLGRDSLQTYVEYGQDTERIEAIGKVFPGIFFLVAALICLTTMTRMVEENRTQIGTMKALGYGKLAIASKYLWYAMSASLVGSVIGFLIGQSLLPIIIINAYRILYNNLSVAVAPVYVDLSISSTILAVGITVLSAGFSCYREMQTVPAQLMRPEAPKNGKRIFLERITFFWKRLSFSNKATARNLFRYKKRFFMTVLGIGGCMGLLMVGFGLKDSIMAIAENQFVKIRTYSGAINLDMDTSEETREHVLKTIQADTEVKAYMEAYETSLDISHEEVTKSSYLVVAKDLEKLPEFVTLQDRLTGKKYSLTDDGVILTEKLAKLLQVSVGDTVFLKDGETKQLEVPVTAVVENYFFHYVYMTPTMYEKLYDEKPEYTEIFVINKEHTSSFEENFQERYMELEGVLNVSFLSTVGKRIDNMIRSMDAVIWIIVIAAGMLAFVVLYNLNNINISERRRELATLKVLGFYEREVSNYVFRENVILTVFGTIVGIVFGILLHRFVILTAEIDLMMFGRKIKGISYLYSVGLTFLFSFLVNLFMHFKLKKLDMVESMKSVE